MTFILGKAPVVLSIIGDLNKSAMTKPVQKVLHGAFGENLTANLANLLTSSNSIYKAGFKNAQNIIDNIAKPIGIALIITFFLITIFGEITRDSLTIESLTKRLIMLVIVFALASQSTALINGALTLGDQMISSTTSSVGLKYTKKGYKTGKTTKKQKKASKATAADIDTLIDKASEEFACKYGPLSLFMVIIIWLVAKVSQVGIFVSVISRGIELIVQAIFLPIGLANSFEGGNSGGIRYFKSFIATALAGAMVLIIVVIGQSLTMGILTASTHSSTNRMMQFIMAAASMAATAKMSISAAFKTKELIS